MKSSHLLRATVVALTLAAAACSSTARKDKQPLAANPFKPEERAARDQKLAADELYRQARQALDSSDFTTAISRYGTIAVRFPFTEYATQADLERIYALHRSYQADDALVAADKFLKEHPRHPAADYVQYLKGLINSSREQGISGVLNLDATKEDVGYLRRAFDDFSLLAQKYPNSPYAGDARQHMIDLRNRIAQHEMHVVDYYMRRGAFLAAAKRAEMIVAQYPGAPATRDALQALEKSYRQAGMNTQADDAGKLLAAERALPPGRSDYPPAAKKPGWFGGKGADAPAPAAIPPTGGATATAPAAAPAEQKSWLKQLFTPGSKEAEGTTVVIPTQPEQPAVQKAGQPATGTDSAPAKTEGDGQAIKGGGLQIYMEPYDDSDAKKKSAPADQKDARPVSGDSAADAKAHAEAKKEGSDSTQQTPP